MVYVIQVCWQLASSDLPSWSCSKAVSKIVRHTPLLWVQRENPYDGQRNCPKHVEFHSKNKFEKLVLLVGFIIITQREYTVLHTLSATVYLQIKIIPCLYNCPAFQGLDSPSKWKMNWIPLLLLLLYQTARVCVCVCVCVILYQNNILYTQIYNRISVK